MSDGGIMSSMFSAFGSIAQRRHDELKFEEANELAYKRQRERELNAYNQSRMDVAQQNAYNSPSEQMQRLRDAGLNPMLAFQNGVQGNLQNSVPNVPDPQQWTPQLAQADMTIFQSIAEQFSRKRELDIEATSAEYNNAKTEAERQSILKDYSFKDAIEADRHEAHQSAILNDFSKRALDTMQRMRLLDQTLNEINQLAEQRRQFDKQCKENRYLAKYRQDFERIEKDKDRVLQEQLNNANNKLYYDVSMATPAQKWKNWRDSVGEAEAQYSAAQNLLFTSPSKTSAALAGASDLDYKRSSFARALEDYKKETGKQGAPGNGEFKKWYDRNRYRYEHKP